MKIETVSARGGVILRLTGDFDSTDRETASRAVEVLFAGGHSRIVFDLQGLGFLGSTGIECLARTHKGAEARGGGVALAGASPFVRKVLGTVGLAGDIAFCATTEEALRSLSPPRRKDGDEEE